MLKPIKQQFISTPGRLRTPTENLEYNWEGWSSEKNMWQIGAIPRCPNSLSRQENDKKYVELLIICIKMWWRLLNSPDQHADRWKAYSVLVSEKRITRVEANKVPQQDCALRLNRETPDFTKLSNTLMKCSYHKKGSHISEFSDERQVRSYIFQTVVCYLYGNPAMHLGLLDNVWMVFFVIPNLQSYQYRA